MRRRGDLRAVAVALCVSLAMVLVAALVLPRAFLTDDDAGLAAYMRKGVYASWMSQVFEWAQIGLYRLEPDVPWFGLYQYVVIAAIGTVTIHTCIELVDPRPGYGHIATLIGAVVISASHMVLATGITWTMVSIGGMCVGTIGFVAHLQICEATGQRVSRVRALVYGLLVVAGYSLRFAALSAMAAALLPLFGWVALRFLRRRYLPSIVATIVFCAPLATVMVVQNRIEQPRGAGYETFNDLRGWIHGSAAFGSLDTRAPEVLARAGWTRDEYLDFANWLYIDDAEFSVDKLTRLVNTGGAPRAITAGEAYDTVRDIVNDAPVSVWVFVAAVGCGLSLAWLRVIDRRRGVVFSLGYLVVAIAVPVWVSSTRRFPSRVSLEFFMMTTFGLFVIIAGEVAAHSAGPEPTLQRDRRGTIALLALSLVLVCWAKNLLVWIDRPRWLYHTPVRQLAERITTRNGFVLVGAGMTELDPMLVDAYSFDGLPAGWGTFSAPWYDYIAQFGFHHGTDLQRWMVDNPNAYILLGLYGRTVYEDWFRRKLHDRSIHLELVDAADMPVSLRSELYRVVSTPLVRGSEEWNLLARTEWKRAAELPGPPATPEPFRSVVFASPYERYVSPVSTRELDVVPIDAGLRITSHGEAHSGCAPVGLGDGYDRIGVHVPITGLGAARFDLALIDPENIYDLTVWGETRTPRSLRWRWELAPEAHEFGFTGTITVMPGYPARRLLITKDTAVPDDVVDLHVIIAVYRGTSAGFEIRNVGVEP